MLWILEGAQQPGLELDEAAIAAFLEDRRGPRYLGDVSIAAKRRWKAAGSTLPEGQP